MSVCRLSVSSNRKKQKYVINGAHANWRSPVFAMHGAHKQVEITGVAWISGVYITEVISSFQGSARYGLYSTYGIYSYIGPS